MGYPTAEEEGELLAALTNAFVDAALPELKRANPLQLASALVMAAAVILGGLGRSAEPAIARWWRHTAPGFFRQMLAMSFPAEPPSQARH